MKTPLEKYRYAIVVENVLVDVAEYAAQLEAEIERLKGRLQWIEGAYPMAYDAMLDEAELAEARGVVRGELSEEIRAVGAGAKDRRLALKLADEVAQLEAELAIRRQWNQEVSTHNLEWAKKLARFKANVTHNTMDTEDTSVVANDSPE